MKKNFFLISIVFGAIIAIVIGKFFLKNRKKEPQAIVIQEQKTDERPIQESESKKFLPSEKQLSSGKKEYLNNTHVREDMGCKYEDDSMFDFAMLSGCVDNDNVGFRDEFYSRKDYATVEEQSINPSEDVVNDLVIQFENVIDYSLGIDFPEDRRAGIRSAQKEMLHKKSVLDNLSEQGLITEQDYTAQLSKQYEESLKKVAEATTDQEFESLYGFKKSDIANSFIELINSFRPNEAE